MRPLLVTCVVRRSYGYITPFVTICQVSITGLLLNQSRRNDLVPQDVMLSAKVIRRPAIPVLAELSLHRLWCPVVKLDARLAAYNTSCPDGIIMDYFDALRADVVILRRCQHIEVLEECSGWRNALAG